jgi:signal transduction histidine kinase
MRGPAAPWARGPGGAPWALTAAAALGAATFTLLVVFLRAFDVAYQSPAMHVALETLAAVIATVAAYLFLGRYRLSDRLADLLLALSLLVLASGSLFFSVLPASLSGLRLTHFSTWAPVMSGVLGAVGFAFAAFSDRKLGRRSGRLIAAAFLGITLLIALLTHLLATRLPVVVPPNLSPVQGGRQLVIGQPVVLALQLLTTLLFASASVGFLRRATELNDQLMRTLSAAAIVGAFASFNYFVFPSLYSRWIYSGDILRFAFYLLLLVGAARELNGYWRGLALVARLEERRRIARDLHDGLAQELAFIASQSRLLGEGLLEQRLAAAAERALEEARRAVDALTRPLDEQVDVAVARAAEEITVRAGAHLTLELESGLDTPSDVSDALRRITREATINAARHGRATQIRVSLHANGSGLRLCVEDNGTGFDPEAPSDGFGLTSMRERALRVGGELMLQSTPGRGTTVEVVLP